MKKQHFFASYHATLMKHWHIGIIQGSVSIIGSKLAEEFNAHLNAVCWLQDQGHALDVRRMIINFDDISDEIRFVLEFNDRSRETPLV